MSCRALQTIEEFAPIASTPIAQAAIQAAILTPTPISTLPAGEIGKAICTAAAAASIDSASAQETLGQPYPWFRGTDDITALGAAVLWSRGLRTADPCSTVAFSSTQAALTTVVRLLSNKVDNPCVLIPCVLSPDLWGVLAMVGVEVRLVDSDEQGPLPGSIQTATATALLDGFDVVGVIVQGSCIVPTGQIMSSSRRTTLTMDVNAAKIVLIEDAQTLYSLYDVDPLTEGQQYPSLCLGVQYGWVAVSSDEVLTAPSMQVAWATLSPSLQQHTQELALLAHYMSAKPTLLTQRATYLLALSLSNICSELDLESASIPTHRNSTPRQPDCKSTKSTCNRGVLGLGPQSKPCNESSSCYVPASALTYEQLLSVWIGFATVRWRFVSMYMARYMDAAIRSYGNAVSSGILQPSVKITVPVGGVWTWVYLPVNKDGLVVATYAIRPTSQPCGVLSWPGAAFCCCDGPVNGLALNLSNVYCTCLEPVWSAIANAITTSPTIPEACDQCTFLNCPPEDRIPCRLQTRRVIPAIPYC